MAVACPYEHASRQLCYIPNLVILCFGGVSRSSSLPALSWLAAAEITVDEFSMIVECRYGSNLHYCIRACKYYMTTYWCSILQQRTAVTLLEIVTDKGVDHEGWRSPDPSPPPRKYVGGVRACLDPLKCHILSLKTVVGQLCKPHNMEDERLVSQMETKTNFSRHLEQFDGLARLTPTVRITLLQDGNLWQ